MASQSDQAKKHRERQALRPFTVPVCPQFAAKKSHIHSPGCINHIPSKSQS